MRTISATEALRRFSDLLDAIEAGEAGVVTRRNRAVAEIRPARRGTSSNLRRALEGISPPDAQFAQDIAAAVANLT